MFHSLPASINTLSVLFLCSLAISKGPEVVGYFNWSAFLIWYLPWGGILAVYLFGRKRTEFDLDNAYVLRSVSFIGIPLYSRRLPIKSVDHVRIRSSRDIDCSSPTSRTRISYTVEVCGRDRSGKEYAIFVEDSYSGDVTGRFAHDLANLLHVPVQVS